MCNKRRTFYKNNKMHSFLLRGFSVVLLFLPFVIVNSCGQMSKQKAEIIKSEYPKLANAILERDFDTLWKFIDHKNEHVRALAWKAISKSDTDDLAGFIDYAIEQDESLSWYALSLHPLSAEQIDRLNELYADGRIESESICEVFFRKGNMNSLNTLLDKPGLISESESYAKAVGGILSRVAVPDLTRRTVLDIAFNSGEVTIWRNLLYGLYRTPLNRPDTGSILNDNISTMLDYMGDSFTIQMDEYIVRIAGKVGFENVMKRRSDHELSENIQLSTELARNVTLFESDELENSGVRRLLKHPVNNVVSLTLQSLQNFEAIPIELMNIIESEIIPNTEDPEIFTEALTVLVMNDRDITDYQSRIERLDAQNEYLKHRFLPLFEEIESVQEYLNRLRSEIAEGGIGGLRAVQALMGYYSKKFQENPELIEDVRSLTRFALDEGDQSVVSALNTLLEGPKVLDESEYEWMYDHYENFVESSQWGKARVLNEVLTNRFPDRFEALEIPGRSFRIPNWNRLYEMGTAPVWTLETEKGIIEIQLDPLAAPFTVSSIDSLTRAGAYDNIPFHRVIQNFVIQGGDFVREDGFGEPDYKLPTEPSFKSFERGMVGMASDGTDTEGSQYFITLNWSPHLDGNYTIFGKVIDGLEVADRIQIGERVLEAEIHE